MSWTTRFRNASIRTKLTVLILAAAATVMTVGLAIELSLKYYEYRERAETTATETANMLATDVLKLVITDSPYVAAEVSERMRSIGAIERALVFELDGAPLFSYTSSEQTAALPPYYVNHTELGGRVIRVWRPVVRDGKPHATFYLEMSLDHLHATWRKHLQALMLGVPFIILFAAWVAYRSQGIFTRPLMALHSAVQHVSATQDFTTRVAAEQNDEIGRLCDGFNAMLERIENNAAAATRAQAALEESNAQLTYLATHDALTGLVNRREFERQLGQALMHVKNNQDQCVLLYLDLDQFKIVNDTCGHIAGDALLRQVTSSVMALLNPNDILGRLGGDEFGVLLCSCCEVEGVARAERMARSMREFRFAYAERVFSLGASIGVVVIAPSHPDVTGLLSAADKACYAAKEAGRSRVHVFREDDEHIVRQTGQMQWVARLRDAADNNRFALYLQRIHPLSAKPTQAEAYEVLLRLHEADGTVVTPDRFVPAAERYGMIDMIDRWVVLAVVELIRTLPAQGRHVDWLSVNLSGHSMSDEGFRRFVTETLDAVPGAARRICFELTETAAVSNLGRAITFMWELKRRGCRFALDDFGTGMASFGYLRQLPVDVLKIDGVFVQNLRHDPIAAAMVKAITEVSHAMGLETIAEGVADQVTYEKLRALGVDYVQGHSLSVPEPATWLRAGAIGRRARYAVDQ